jgi:hypothetical protein
MAAQVEAAITRVEVGVLGTLAVLAKPTGALAVLVC